VAHLSYILGDDREAAVIDPRRDDDVYLRIARREGTRITHIFETHRNEDYVIGSCDLARHTGAEIHHGKALDFQYGSPVSEGDTFEFGNVRLRVLETPGHTDESISVVLSDTASGDSPVAVFTGDALFIGDTGRTDFFPDRAEEVAGLLYDSIFQKLLPLGDGVILYPAHGAGSVCGDAMAEREFSTIGYERANSTALQFGDRDAFIQHKLNEKHYQPPYFRKMEELNLNGAPPLDRLPTPPPLSPEQCARARDRGMQIVDTRKPEAFAGAFVPGSLSLPMEMIPAYGGYFLSYDRPIGIIVEDSSQVETAVRYLIRMGYDNLSGFLRGGLHDWESAGLPFERVGRISAQKLLDRIQSDGAFTLLDVRKEPEFRESRLEKAQFAFLGHLPDKVDEIPRDQPVVTICDTGRRAMIAASYLKMNGFDPVTDTLGSMEACEQIGCPLVGEDVAQEAAS
jgi:hydroxyacylglutathione hydrolase